MMGEYSRREFLRYYKFKDEPNYLPKYFHHRRHAYTDLIDAVKEDIKIGVKLKDAICFNAGIPDPTFYRWQKEFVDEVQEGKTDTPLIRLFNAGLKSNARLYREVMKMAMDKARDGDGETIRFLAKNRLGYGRQQTNVNVDNLENNTIQISITDMKGIETDAPIDINATVEEPKKEIPTKKKKEEEVVDTSWIGVAGTIYDEDMEITDD